MNDLIVLPKFIAKGDYKIDGSFFIYNHQSNKQSMTNKILLEYNLISFLQSGEKTLQYANKTSNIKDTHIAILTSGNCLMTNKLSSENNYCSTLFFFDDISLNNFFFKYKNLIKTSSRQVLEAPFVTFSKDDYIQHFIQSLQFVTQKLNPSQVLLQLKFEEFMLYLLDKYPNILLSLKKTTNNLNGDFKIKEAVEKNITTNISLVELAFLCNTSLSSFKRKFVKIYNIAPSQYFLKKKMELAESLLIIGLNPSEISYKIGYDTPSSFSKSFKQFYGLSPKKYQQQKLNG